MGLRYVIDFHIIPKLFINAPDKMLVHLENGTICDFLYTVFEDAYEGMKKFNRNEFECKKYEDGECSLYYITLPREHEGSMVWCNAYGFAFRITGDSIIYQMYTVEETDSGMVFGEKSGFPKTNMLCGVDPEMNHLNFGPSSEFQMENVERMIQLTKAIKIKK